MSNQILNPKSKIVLLISSLVGLLVIIAVTWYRIELIRPASKQSQTVAFEIEPGTPSKIIAQQLKQQKIINSTSVFLFYIKFNGITLHSGFYNLDPAKPIAEIAEVIGKGKVSDYKVTIIEGWRNEQIAQALAKQKIVSYEEFMKATTDKEGRTKQGRLFPDTYRFSVDVSADQIVEKLEKNFERRLKDAEIDSVSAENLILASIVEREAKHDEDRPKMAGVYFNRLAIGMALEADPGTQYAVDSEKVSKLSIPEIINYQFWDPITSEQNKNFDSPYNTYRRRGLPPAPIANPGLKSIQAAINPEKHNFYFFFNLKDGTTIYSKTRDEHDANRKKYGV